MLTQIEACLNSPLIASGHNDDGIEPLTPGHFLMGRSLEALPDPSQSSFGPPALASVPSIGVSLLAAMVDRKPGQSVVSPGEESLCQ